MHTQMLGMTWGEDCLRAQGKGTGKVRPHGGTCLSGLQQEAGDDPPQVIVALHTVQLHGRLLRLAKLQRPAHATESAGNALCAGDC